MPVDGDFEKILMGERPRLVRLCARLSGSREAAEDLAQETLLAAWRATDRLAQPEQYAPWLSAIARNVCLNWARQHYREQARLVRPAHPAISGTDTLDTIPDGFDLEVELERDELALLLDRALALLPRETGTLLVQHYLEESPHAEIAARLAISEGAVGVRLHRGKLALRRILTEELSAEAAAYGLADEWTETRIWCPQCGGRRLLVRLENRAAGGRFFLRCPACDSPDQIMTGADLSVPAYAQLLGNVRAYKPALARLQGAVATYFRQALAEGQAHCLVCGRPAQLWWGKAPGRPQQGDEYKLFAGCDACGWGSNSTLVSLIMASPEGRRFWQEHPKMRTLPTLEVEANGVPALVTRLESVTDGVSLAVVSARDTFDVLAIHNSPDT